MEKQKSIPVLRFPEYTDEWQLTKIRDHTISSAFGPRFSSSFYNSDGNIATLRTTDMDIDGNLDLTQLPLAILDVEQFKEHLLQKGDLLISRSGTIGVTGIFNDFNLPVLAGAFLIRFRLESSTINSKFLQLYLNSSKGHIKLLSLSAGGVQKNLTGTSILDLQITIPPHPEQTKIASFLTAIDDRLNQLKKKKSLLEQYKKGVMQKIFDQEIRFKDEDGNGFPDWEIKPLGELCEIAKSGGTPTSTKKEYYSGDIPFLSISDMTQQGKYLNFTSNHISKSGIENSSSWIVPANSIIYSMYASVGFVAINRISLATSQAVLNLIVKKDYNVEFVYYSLVQFQKQTIKYITTGTQGNLNAQTVKSFSIGIPSQSEQTKIASFLSAIDEKISLCNTQITKTEQYKKGLLQQMFV